MQVTVEIFKGNKRLVGPICCGAEVTSSFMSSCCGIQEIADDIKIASLYRYLAEDKLEDKVKVAVNDVSAGGDALELFWQRCETSGISRETDIGDLLPIVVIDNQVKFVKRIPTGDEFIDEIEALATP